MNKTDQSLHKICIAAIKRSAMLDYASDFIYSKFYESSEEYIELLLQLNITLHNDELLICSVIVDDQNWSVLTTQRLFNCLEHERLEVNIDEISAYKFGVEFKDKDQQTVFGSMHSENGLEIPFFIETGKASMIMIQAVKTVIDRFSNVFKISVRFGHMHGLLGETFFAVIAALLPIKIMKSSNSGSREKQTVIANTLLNLTNQQNEQVFRIWKRRDLRE